MTEYLGTKRMRRERKNIQKRMEEKPLYNKKNTNYKFNSMERSFTRNKVFIEKTAKIECAFQKEECGRMFRRCRDDVAYLFAEHFPNRKEVRCITEEVRRLYKLIWVLYEPQTMIDVVHVGEAVIDVVRVIQHELGATLEKLGAEAALEYSGFRRKAFANCVTVNSKNAGRYSHNDAMKKNKYVRGKDGRLVNALSLKVNCLNKWKYDCNPTLEEHEIK